MLDLYHASRDDLIRLVVAQREALATPKGEQLRQSVRLDGTVGRC